MKEKCFSSFFHRKFPDEQSRTVRQMVFLKRKTMDFADATVAHKYVLNTRWRARAHEEPW